jgi:cation/acetate symporter
MSIQSWTYVMVALSFGLYISIAVITRVKSTRGFYVAGQGVPAVYNGMATAADWMSAASFISMAGMISFMGYQGSVYLLGWTGGYVLLALLLAPYLRKFGKFTVPDFVGDRYYSNFARLVAIFCAIFISITYVAGQMRGVGVVFSRFLEVDVNTGVVIGMVIVFFYATLGGMKGITWTQVAQYCVLIVAYIIPAVAISLQLTGNPIPQLGFGGIISGGERAGIHLLEAIDHIHRDLGLPEYTAAFPMGAPGMVNMIAITIALMVGTAGLPHVIIRFYTVRTVQAARWSAVWALLFIALLYTTAPAIAAFARVNLVQTLDGVDYENRPEWFQTWERTGLIRFNDLDGDGIMRFSGDPAENEIIVDRDIIVLATPEIANLPAWVVALVAAGGLAAALSTAAGLLLVISSSISHDLIKRILRPNMTERQELLYARIAAGVAVCVAGLSGIYPLGFVAQVVAFAFGLAASSFFPIIVLGIFSTRTTREGAIAGMLTGILFTAGYIIYYRTIFPKLWERPSGADDWWWGISPEGIGTIGMLLNFAVTIGVSAFTKAPPQHVQETVRNIRLPSESGNESLPSAPEH